MPSARLAASRNTLRSPPLAEYQAGLVTGRRGRAIARRLTGCTECVALSDRLAQVSVLLAAAPAPAMPDALARRLDSALAAEAEKPISTERASVHPPSHRRTPSWGGLAGRSARRARAGGRPFGLRVLAPAAAALAVLGGAVYGLTMVGGSSTSSGPDPATAGNSAGHNVPSAANGVLPTAAGKSGSGGTYGPQRRDSWPRCSARSSAGSAQPVARSASPAPTTAASAPGRRTRRCFSSAGVGFETRAVRASAIRDMVTAAPPRRVVTPVIPEFTVMPMVIRLHSSVVTP
jgi:hypothetical protein